MLKSPGEYLYNIELWEKYGSRKGVWEFHFVREGRVAVMFPITTREIAVDAARCLHRL